MSEEIIPPDQVVEALASSTAAAPEPADQVEVKSTPASKPPLTRRTAFYFRRPSVRTGRFIAT